jgi:hypothetical protein
MSSPDRVALDEHRVEAVAHRGERVVLGHHRRVDPHRDRAVVEAFAIASSLST